MLEAVLMRGFVMLYSHDYETDDDRWPYRYGKCRTTERRAFVLLSSVCCNWHQTLTGWPQSSTPHWVRHQLKKLIECKYIYSRKFRTVWTTRSRLLIGWHGHVVRGVHFPWAPGNNLPRMPPTLTPICPFSPFLVFPFLSFSFPPFFLSSVFSLFFYSLSR